MTATDVTSATYPQNELLLRYLIAAPAGQFSQWKHQGVLPKIPTGEGPGKPAEHNVEHGLIGTTMAQLMNTVCVSAKKAGSAASEATDKIMASPAYKILTDPDNAPDGEYFLQFRRLKNLDDDKKDKLIPELVEGRDDLNFSRGYTSLVINIGELLRDIADQIHGTGAIVERS